MRGVCDSAVGVNTLAISVSPCCLPVALAPSAHLILAISELINLFRRCPKPKLCPTEARGEKYAAWDVFSC